MVGVAEHEEARVLYAEPVGLGSEEFVDMLVLDGCFPPRAHAQLRQGGRGAAVAQHPLGAVAAARRPHPLQEPDPPLRPR